jgi:aspartate/methionine/tyrosine aminotransferase
VIVVDNMNLSRKMSRLGTESAFRVLARAQALEAKGIDVIHLEIGEPDFATPQHIADAAARAVKEGLTHYCNSQGILPLRAAIARQIEKTRGVAIDPECVVVTPGAKPIMFYVILALLEEGDEAIYPDPSFPIFKSMIDFTGAKAVPLPMREELDFCFDIDEFKSKVTSRTKLIIVNSPHNPTGSVLTRELMQAVAGIACERDIVVLSDEIYESFSYEGESLSIASLPGMPERTILLSGFSKTYAMTGWRLGYAAVPKNLVEPIVRLIVNSASCTVPFIQHAGIEALIGPQDFIPGMVNEFKQRRDLIVDGLNEIPGISCRKPKGAFYTFPNIKKTGMKSSALAEYILKEAHVALLAGSDFGKCGEGYLRLSYANSQQNLQKALDRIGAALKKI